MTIKKTKNWFEVATPNPTEDNKKIQLGVHAEEFKEMLDTIEVLEYPELVTRAKTAVHELAEQLKKNKQLTLVVKDPDGFLDAICDQLVTATGCGHMYGHDVAGALDEVNRSNFSKFVDGKPVFNEHGKISKGPEYSKPNIKPFVKQ